jgi:hypothetical protein
MIEQIEDVVFIGAVIIVIIGVFTLLKVFIVKLIGKIINRLKGGAL